MTKPYGAKRDYKKIDIFCRRTGKYLASTTWARSPKQARVKYADQHGWDWRDLRASYA